MPKPAKKQPDLTAALHDVEVSRLKGEIADWREKYKLLSGRLREADDRLDAVMSLKSEIDGHAPYQIRVKQQGKRSESTAVIVLSDIHVEERVDPRTVDGVNEYTPEIATRRVAKFFENSLSMVEMCRTRSNIDTIVLCILGDAIAGAIHDELAESNYLSPTEATLKAYRLLCGGINFLLEHGGIKQLLIPCNVGNHGRTTKKMRISTSTKNSYEWMLYHLLADKYSDDDRVKFQIADGYFNFVQIYDTLLRTHHGDNVRYQGGVGGLSIPLNKAIAQWNKLRRADVDVLGHWHQRLMARDFVVNGSVVGFNAFSISIKASYEPPCQSFFMVHPERGKTVEIPIFMN